jgi:hypothetical protein
MIFLNFLLSSVLWPLFCCTVVGGGDALDLLQLKMPD